MPSNSRTYQGASSNTCRVLELTDHGGVAGSAVPRAGSNCSETHELTVCRLQASYIFCRCTAILIRRNYCFRDWAVTGKSSLAGYCQLLKNVGNTPHQQLCGELSKSHFDVMTD